MDDHIHARTSDAAGPVGRSWAGTIRPNLTSPPGTAARPDREAPPPGAGSVAAEPIVREPAHPEAYVPGERLSGLLFWVYRRPQVFPLATDLAAWPVGLLAGAVLDLTVRTATATVPLVLTTTLAVAVHAGAGHGVGLYRRRWRIASFPEMSTLGLVWGAASLVVVATTLLARAMGSRLTLVAAVGGCLLTLLALTAQRVLWRRFWEAHRRPDPRYCRPTIVVGAGESGSQIIRIMVADPDSEYFPVALVDDDPAKRHREVQGVRVWGTRADLERVAVATRAEVLLVAVSEADSALVADLSRRAMALGLQLRVLPPASELVTKLTVADVRPPTVDDLLGRGPVEIDHRAIASMLEGRRVLVTGAGGSIGAELAELIAGFGPASLQLLDHDEHALQDTAARLTSRPTAAPTSASAPALGSTPASSPAPTPTPVVDRLIVADIRDRDRVFDVIAQSRPEVVFHAAGLDNQALLEANPTEAIKTNAVGTKNLLDAAASVGTERFVNLSTDAVSDESSALGASKLAAEKLTALVAFQTGSPYVSVRFGTVLGSRSSLLPALLRQIELGQPITLSHPDTTRYVLTLAEAVRLIVQAGAVGEPGEVLVLDMGHRVRIADLAERLVTTLRPGTPIEFAGLAPGETLHGARPGPDQIGVARHHPRILHTTADLVDPSGLLAQKTGIDERDVRRMLGIRRRSPAPRLQEVAAR